MESSEDVEVLSKAIEKLLDERRKRDAAGDSFVEDDDDQLLLSRLLSQLETPKQMRNADDKADGATAEEQPADSSTPPDKPEVRNQIKGRSENQKKELSTEELAEEIKKVKRQNTITHLLLSAMIILTLSWQLSEFSIIMTMKNRLSHPFRSFGGMLAGMMKGGVRPITDQLPEIQCAEPSKEQNNHNGTHSLPSLKVPEMLRDLGFNEDDQ
ncbi:PREDICTED: uncharacterized protein LOC104807506 [Tarenaya hassleriana]|uniref:uncharacterized protein LOC104807506 n=1 Tax=Tarenaya hassleriana TaxID=28532 RepID=UPI00053C39D2|nr:PREDICTED: uncharacterized protein LOC104807506 [Tarenaya hassleriana]